MGNFSRDDRPAGGYRGGFSRGGGRPGGFSRGRSSFGGGDRGSDRPMFKTVCSNCGKECEVPFRPTNGKPVYCSDCFEKMGGRRSDSRRPERSDFRAPSIDQSKSQFDAINIKLDKILSLLTPVTPTSTPTIKEEEIVKEVKSPKIKKVVKKVASTRKK